MTDVKARIGKIAVSTNGTTYTAVGGIKDYSDPISRGTIDATDFDSGGWQEFLDGLGNGTLSITLNYDEDDAGQDIVRTANEGGTSLFWRVRPKGDNTGDDEVIWPASVITGFEKSGAVDGLVEISLDVQLSGTPTFQAQP